jgi:hypothetical protein
MLQSQVSGFSAATYLYDAGKMVDFNLLMSIIILCVQQLCKEHGERELLHTNIPLIHPTPMNITT